MARKFLTAVDLAKNELQNAAVQSLASAPSNPAKFQLYGNSADNVLYWWNGTTWVSAAGGGGGGSFPGYGSVPAETTFGITKADGTATTVARSDHTHGSPAHDTAEHSAFSLSIFAAPTTAISMGAFRVTNVAQPVGLLDAANKNYVDNLVAGLSWKEPARVASTANVASIAGLLTVDGVTTVSGDRVLLKDQTTASQNGIWVVSGGAWVRATDADLGAKVEGMAVFVLEGTTNSDKAYVCTTNAPIAVNTTPLTFVQFGGGNAYTAGAGLVGATTFDVGAGTGITVAADSVALDTTYADARYALKAAGALRLGGNVTAAVSTVVTHNFNTRDVLVDVYRVAAPYDSVEVDVERTDLNNVTVRFATAPAAGEYRVVVMA
jgi:hypothetical protein